MRNARWLSRHDDGRHFMARNGTDRLPAKHWQFKKQVPEDVMSESVKKILEAPKGGIGPGTSAHTATSIKRSTGYLKVGPLKINKASIETLRDYAKKKGTSFKLVLMSPKEFLSRVPSTLTADIPAIVQKPRHFDQSTVAYAKRAVKAGKAMDVAMLDYSQPKAGWASHDSRHRAFAYLQLGIPAMPVVVLGEPEIKMGSP